MPFPILRTPSVVLSEIISLLQPNEIVTASFCSKNLERLLQNHFRQRKPLKWRLHMIDYKSCGQAHIKTSEDAKQIPVLLAKHMSELKRQLSWKCPVLYSNDQILGTKMTVEYVTDLFGLDIHELLTDRNSAWAIQWVNNRQKNSLYNFAFNKTRKCNSDADEALDFVLRNARASNYCSIEGSVSDNFKFDGKLGPMRKLTIPSNGHWVTGDNLSNFDAIEITIQGSRLSVSDLNVFLRHWRAGGLTRLEWLHLNFEEHTFRESYGYKKVVHGGYSVQRVDGVKALIQCDLRRFVMVVWHQQ
ncbi:hypothetical protein B9Z55_015881 [Caenorhabditis nigoni]|uniref:F-box domain-containing protein n=1 Tax=Caenorhabditis nigoni TaxID=1611254 RepID=A0A2G5UC86_9PELO|nr:hypothetical protein B9Z55_015881 [Caenorhabditis nigoni]